MVSYFIRLTNAHHAILIFYFCRNGSWCNENPGPGSPKGLHQGAIVELSHYPRMNVELVKPFQQSTM
jgi:hypothetical protein